MPLYHYQCPRCRAETSDLRKMDERDDGPICYRCAQAQMNLILCPVAGIVKNPAVPKQERVK